MLARLDRAVTLLFGGVIFVCAALVTLSIVLRELGVWHSWIDPVVRYSILWCALLGLWASGGLRQDPHISAEMLVSRAGPDLRRVLGIIRYGVALVFMVALGYYGWLQVANELQSGIKEQSTLRLPYAWLHLAIPVAAVLYVFVTALRIRGIFKRLNG